MGGRGLTVAAVLLAVLAGGLWWSNREKAKEATKPSVPDSTTPKILSLTESDINKIELKKKGGDDTVLERKNGKWAIVAPQPYLADQDTASGLATSAATVNSDRLVDEKPGDIKQFGLDNPSLEVDLTQKNGKMAKLLIGDDAPGGNSAYAKLDGDPRVFTVASFTKTGLDKRTQDLRDKRLLTFDQDKLSRVELLAKKQDIEFARSKDEWQILKPGPYRADGLQVEELVRKLKDAKMDLSASEQAGFASGMPVATVKVTDNTGTQELQVRKKGDDYFAKSSAVEGTYKVPSDLGTALDKSAEDFRNKKLFDFGFSEPNKLEMHDNGKSYSFTKSGDKWFSNGKEMDNTSVQAFLDKLRDLSAFKFVDSGFTTPVADLTVVSNDNKRTEKLLISKSGDVFVAKRENEPSLYELDAKTVDELGKAASDVKPAQAAAKKK